MEILQHEIERVARSSAPLGVLMLDIDRFKTVNDTFGHLAGDVVLREVAQRVATSVRSYDYVGRYGGEEFIAVLPGCGAADVWESAERIRRAVRSTPVVTTGAHIPITVSVGATVVGSSSSAHEAVREADIAMYRAKEAGRDRSEVFVEQNAER
jgi:diguanylate cyclase (GGDEF)-like protein